MTPLQYIVAQISPVIQANNPGASADEVTSFATQLGTFYIGVILPNLQVNLTTGVVNFVVPSGS